MDALRVDSANHERAFSALAHRILVTERRAVLKDLAADLGLTYVSLYARLRGRVPFSAEQAAMLLKKVPDQRFADFFVSGTAFVAVPRLADGDGSGTGDLLEGALGALENNVSLLRTLQHALRDGVLEHDEVDEIERRIHDAEVALVTLHRRLQRCALNLPSFRTR